ncbi:hypothetical protein E4U16_003650 [Claviceps sp. LM84 group G4]|nr:hypothetical protein E4U16_003650 [Claviceps sp. LM84 group G4]
MVCLQSSLAGPRGNANAGVDADGPIKSISVWHNGQKNALSITRYTHLDKCLLQRQIGNRVGTEQDLDKDIRKRRGKTRYGQRGNKKLLFSSEIDTEDEASLLIQPLSNRGIDQHLKAASFAMVSLIRRLIQEIKNEGTE